MSPEFGRGLKKAAKATAFVAVGFTAAEAASDTIATPIADAVTSFTHDETSNDEELLELCFPSDGQFAEEANTRCPEGVAGALGMTEDEVLSSERDTLREDLAGVVAEGSTEKEKAKERIEKNVKMVAGLGAMGLTFAGYKFAELWVASNDRWTERTNLKRRATKLAKKSNTEQGLSDEENEEFGEIMAFLYSPGHMQWPKWREERREDKRIAKQERRADSDPKEPLPGRVWSLPKTVLGFFRGISVIEVPMNLDEKNKARVTNQESSLKLFFRTPEALEEERQQAIRDQNESDAHVVRQVFPDHSEEDGTLDTSIY